MSGEGAGPREVPPEALILVDAAGYVRYLSPGAAMLLGGSREAAAVPVEDLFGVAVEERESVAAALAELRTGGRPRVGFEVAVQDRAGTWRTVAISGENLLDEPGVGRVVLHVTDVTARTELEEQVRRAQRLQAAGRLAAGIAHDFRNVLTVIRASAELARESLPPEHFALGELAEISSAADRATSLTEQLLAFGRREGDGRGPADVNQVTTGLRPLLTRLMGETVRVDLELDPSVPLVAVDPGQLEQVLLNLATNARDAMPAGGRFVVRTSTTTAGPDEGTTLPGLLNGGYAVLEAQDEGEGMDPETLGHVFEPFFTTHPERGGTGLGLATVYAIVARSGGQIHVRSERGRGTMFRAYLPLLRE